MKIAILRSEQADRERTYNKVEYAAAFHGVCVVGYVDARGPGAFRGQPLLTPESLVDLGIEMIVAASPLTPELRHPLEALGWTGDRLLSHVTHQAECRARWQSSAWLAVREPTVADGELDLSTRYAKIGDPAVHDVRSVLTPSDLLSITKRVLDAYIRAMRDAPTSGPYAVGRNWGNFLRVTRPRFYEAVARRDVPALDTLLGSFFRNEMTTGTFGGCKAYDAYDAWVAAGASVHAAIRQQFNVWRYSVATPDVARLATPPVGNPYGVWIDQGIVHPNAFLNDYRAGFVLGLVENLERPIVIDLGGGFGGFCQQLIAHNGHTLYVGFDLPDNLIVASYFLLAAHPEKRVLFYESPDQRLDPEALQGYDVILMPNFMLPHVPDRSVDVFTNFISLSEMDYSTIGEYLRQVDRVCSGFFYQENLFDNGDNYEFYPVPVFPQLPHFKQLSSAPSRWPFFSATSPHHCHGEFLSVRRDIDHLRYLSSPRDEWARLKCHSAA